MERLIKKAKRHLNYNSYTEPYFALVKAVRQSLIKYTSSLKDSKDEVKEMLHISPMLSATNALYNKNYKEMIEWLETKNLEKIYLEMESLVHQSNEVIKVFETNIEDGHSPTSTDGKDSPAATEVQKIDMLIDNPEESKNSFSDYEEDEDDYIPNVSKNYIALSVNPTASPTAANALAVNPMASPPASNEVISNHCPPHLSVTNDQYRGSEMITSSQQPMVVSIKLG
uniref:SPK domain-containing protein n=1 Tax=Caenorhabditis japonica TaxID=281687 RepID=A0A8R1EBA4_CAEJA